MLIIETVGGILLGISAIGFILLAALDEPVRAWVGADRSRSGSGESKSLPNERPTLANVAALEPGLAEDRRIAA
jgi:hypothetical protein